MRRPRPDRDGDLNVNCRDNGTRRWWRPPPSASGVVRKMSSTGLGLAKILEKHEADLLADWYQEQTAAAPRRPGMVKDADIRDQSREFLGLFRGAVRDARGDDV